MSDPKVLEEERKTNESRLKQAMSKIDRDIRELNKNGQTSHMYEFYIKQKDNYSQFIKKLEKLDFAKDELKVIIASSEAMKNITVQECLKKLSAKFQQFFQCFI